MMRRRRCIVKGLAYIIALDTAVYLIKYFARPTIGFFDRNDNSGTPCLKRDKITNIK